MTRKMLVFGFLLIAGIFFLNCEKNIFSIFYPESSSTVVDSNDVNDYITQGDAYLAKGDPYNAWLNYDAAVKKFPTSGIARSRAARAYIIYKGNVDLMMIASQFSAGNDMADVITDFATSLNDLMDKIIYYLSDIAKKKCDDSVPYNDFEVNINLSLANFIKAFLVIGDSNNDGVYFSTGDLFIAQGGSIDYNQDFINIDGLQSSLEGDIDNIISILDTGSGTISRSVVSNIIVTSHDLVEMILTVYSIAYRGFSYFNEANYALNNAISGLPSDPALEDFRQEANERFTEINGYLNGAEEDTSNLSSDHFKLVGVHMNSYVPNTKWYTNFTTSVWSSHFSVVSSPTNLLWSLSTHPGDYDVLNTNDLKFLSELTNSIMSIMRHVAEGNLVNNIMGGGS